MSDSNRPRVTYEAGRKAVEQALAQLARTMQQLEAAVASFPPDFDRVAFGAAWYSKDAGERNRAMLVRSNSPKIWRRFRPTVGRLLARSFASRACIGGR